jgi:hypothetical protein
LLVCFLILARQKWMEKNTFYVEPVEINETNLFNHTIQNVMEICKECISIKIMY